MFWVSGPPLCVTVTTAISMWEGSTERQAQGTATGIAGGRERQNGGNRSGRATGPDYQFL